MSSPDRPDPVAALERAVSADCAAIRRARDRAIEERERIQAIVERFVANDEASFVVFGSLARREFTTGSDCDWTLLIDHRADPQHLVIAQDLRNALDRGNIKQPGREGIFGGITFSHELIHKIGGQLDTNANLTRRILLLLESLPIGRREAYDRVQRNLLRRYLAEDRGFWSRAGRPTIPRFLLNDVVRYWRTMAVDFAAKQRARGNEGYALRNIKLRLSRKLIFLSGLLVCFSTELERPAFLEATPLPQAPPLIEAIEYHCRLLDRDPLEQLAHALVRIPGMEAPKRAMFGAYDRFLNFLNSDERLPNGRTPRDHLETLSIDALDEDPTFHAMRVISHEFRDAVFEIFLENHESNRELYRLTKEYGVF